jgi:hypothetical protein
MAVKDSMPADVRKRAAVNNPDWYSGRLKPEASDRSVTRTFDDELRRSAAEHLRDQRHHRGEQHRQGVANLVLAPVRLMSRLLARRRHA